MSSDGLCRTIDVRKSNGESKGSIHNVCPIFNKDIEKGRLKKSKVEKIKK